MAHDLLRYLKNEIEYRKGNVIDGIVCQSADLPAQYNYKIAYIHALTAVQEWVKDWEARKLSAELED